jgi:hypothetical protein
MTPEAPGGYPPAMMEGWQHKGAFVIQFRAEADIESGMLEGRVEHVASSKAAHFHSLDELLVFLGRVLTDVRAEPQEHF